MRAPSRSSFGVISDGERTKSPGSPGFPQFALMAASNERRRGSLPVRAFVEIPIGGIVVQVAVPADMQWSAVIVAMHAVMDWTGIGVERPVPGIGIVRPVPVGPTRIGIIRSMPSPITPSSIGVERPMPSPIRSSIGVERPMPVAVMVPVPAHMHGPGIGINVAVRSQTSLAGRARVVADVSTCAGVGRSESRPHSLDH